MIKRSPAVIDGMRPQKSGSHQTLPGRKRDSNRRSPVAGATRSGVPPFDFSASTVVIASVIASSKIPVESADRGCRVAQQHVPIGTKWKCDQLKGWLRAALVE
jgi:hypothetical protein